MLSQLTIQSDAGSVSKGPQIARNSVRKVEDVARTTCSWSYFIGRYSQALGLQFTVVQTQGVKEKDISVHIGSEVPFLRSALQLQCRLAFPSYSSISFCGNGGLPRIIPDDSDYLLACRRGDFSSVREMFRKGTARPEDTSKGNMTPLLVCGSIKAQSRC